jgi:hypothetical protein
MHENNPEPAVDHACFSWQALINSFMNASLTHAPNLTQRRPRSPRVHLGGYVILACIFDKGRAQLAGNQRSSSFALDGLRKAIVIKFRIKTTR